MELLRSDEVVALDELLVLVRQNIRLAEAAREVTPGEQPQALKDWHNRLNDLEHGLAAALAERNELAHTPSDEHLLLSVAALKIREAFGADMDQAAKDLIRDGDQQIRAAAGSPAIKDRQVRTLLSPWLD